MRMGKEENGYKKWYKLVYFRWKALIRSKEYLSFYENKVKKFLDKKAVLNLEQQRSLNKALTIDTYLDSFINSENANKLYVPNIEQGYPPFDLEESELLEEAEKRFGLIVSWVEALIPLNMDYFPPNKDRWITFKEYLPFMPDDHQQKEFFEKFVIEEIKKEDDFRFGIEVHLNTFPNKKLFLIDADMPIGLIISVLKKKLGYSDEKKKDDRKDFDKWEEAFKVWDIQQITNNLYKTAKLMGWHKIKNRKGNEYTKEELRDIVNKKIKVADKLINLAGQGKFKTFI